MRGVIISFFFYFDLIFTEIVFFDTILFQRNYMIFYFFINVNEVVLIQVQNDSSF